MSSSILSRGGSIGYYQGETIKIAEDLAALRPTLFPSVPRLLNKFYDKVHGGAQSAGGIKTKLFNKGYASKKKGLRKGKQTSTWDKLVFKKIAKTIGLDECKLILTGSAPIAPHVIEFLRILVGCPVVEGYGQTEGFAGCTMQAPSDFSTGNVGAPLTSNQVRLISVPDMGYSVTDTSHGGEGGKPGVPCVGRGEICFTGPSVFKGFYKMPDKTAEALNRDGWVLTGDIGLWTPEGQLKIIDRKKNIFKLAQGEYIAPEKIENVYQKVGIVQQCFVYGDSFQHQLVGIVVPDPEQLSSFCAANGIPGGSPAELCRNPALNKAIHEEMDRARKEASLLSFEHVAKIHLSPDAFTPENDLLTPTFKLKRDVAKKQYEKEIDAMYTALGGMKNRQG